MSDNGSDNEKCVIEYADDIVIIGLMDNNDHHIKKAFYISELIILIHDEKLNSQPLM